MACVVIIFMKMSEGEQKCLKCQNLLDWSPPTQCSIVNTSNANICFEFPEEESDLAFPQPTYWTRMAARTPGDGQIYLDRSS